MIETRKNGTTDTYHGVEVADPYRWLEAETDEVHAWVEAQNQRTEEYLSALPNRQQLRDRLAELWNFPRAGVPKRAGGRYFFSRNSGLQDQSVFYVRDSMKADPRELLDPNTLSDDGTIAVPVFEPSRDGRYVAYGLSEAGSDWEVLRVRDVETTEDLEDTLRWAKFPSIAWHPDGSGFFYNCFPDPTGVPDEEQNYNNRIYFHRLGDSQDQDELIYERPDDKRLRFEPEISEDGRYLVLTGGIGTDPENQIVYRELESDGPFIDLLVESDAEYWFITNDGTMFYVLTNRDAPRYKLVAIKLDQPEPEHWREIIPEGTDAIDEVVAAADGFAVTTLHDANHQLRFHSRDGEIVRDIELPAIGAIQQIEGKEDDTDLYYLFTSFLYPPTPFRCDLSTGESKAMEAPSSTFDPSDYETIQVFVDSTDGARVPMFLTYRRGLDPDGRRPTLLYAYGGFNIPVLPGFRAEILLLLEAGGIFAQASLRGGSEYGEDWHRAGMLDQKQHVFDDFIACAEWLDDCDYTNRRHLAITGRSNGGLLVAACLTQRPDLYGAVLCEVPVIDMLRYHRFTVGHYWIGEYGSADDPEQFPFLYAYSPLHNVREGVEYPPTLINSAASDDRVVPGHARKFAATLQAAQAGDAPILLRIEDRAGHGHGKPVSKQIADRADVYAFLLHELGGGD